MEKIQFYDTTMRDWHQCPWASIANDKDYFEYINLANKVGFDFIEAWFPFSSQKEFKRVNTVSKMTESWEISPIIAWLCQLVPQQVETTIRCLEPSAKIWKSLVHTYFPVDPALIKASVPNANKKEVIEELNKLIKLITKTWNIAQFSPEWYSMVWENFDFCTDLIISAVDAWAKWINCPDTRWSADRFQWKDYYVNNMIRHKEIIDKLFPNNEVGWSIHNHNDFWEANENSIEWIVNWIAKKIEWTINWVWERAWNADLAVIIMRIKKYLSKYFDINHIDTKQFTPIWKHVSKVMLPTQPHYPISWANASRHTSWWHVNAILNNPLVYQAYDPAEVWWKIELVFWPNSWSALARQIIIDNYWTCTKEESKIITQYIKEYWKDRYKWVTNEELMEAYHSFRMKESKKTIQINGYQKNIISNNLVEVKFSWLIFWEKNITLRWRTPFTALKKHLSIKYPLVKIDKHTSDSESKWEDSISISKITISFWSKTIESIWRDIDIETASLKALANAYNKYSEEFWIENKNEQKIDD